jgi:hypothetical protein
VAADPKGRWIASIQNEEIVFLSLPLGETGYRVKVPAGVAEFAEHADGNSIFLRIQPTDSQPNASQLNSKANQQLHGFCRLLVPRKILECQSTEYEI